MGCDIHVMFEKFNDKTQAYESMDPGVVEDDYGARHPFYWRSYNIFAFLAGVRNYSDITPISDPRGVPSNTSFETQAELAGWGCDAHSESWLSIQELHEFDYNVILEDKRCTRKLSNGVISGGCTCNPGEGVRQDYREYLGEYFFASLAVATNAGVDRIVFWFDN